MIESDQTGSNDSATVTSAGERVAPSPLASALKRIARLAAGAGGTGAAIARIETPTGAVIQAAHGDESNLAQALAPWLHAVVASHEAVAAGPSAAAIATADPAFRTADDLPALDVTPPDLFIGLPTGEAGGRLRGCLCLVSGTSDSIDADGLATLRDHVALLSDMLTLYSFEGPNTDAGGEPTEQRLRGLLEAIPTPIWTANPDGKLDYANSVLYDSLGLTPETLPPERWLDTVHPEDKPRVKEIAETSYRLGEPYSAEMRLRHGDGTYHWYIDVAWPLRDKSGTIIKYYGTVTNIDTVKSVAEALTASEARLRAIFESEPECVKLVSPNGLLQDMNPAGLKLVEAEAKDAVLDRPVAHLIHPEDRAIYNALHEAALRGKNGRDAFRIVGLNGTVRWMSSHASPLRSPNGEIEGVLSVTRDISDRRRDTELRRLEARVLDEISAGKPLQTILETITRAVDRLEQGVRSSILLIEDGHLVHGAAPNLPDAYNRLVHGIAVAEGVGSCGTAAARVAQVVVSDIANDPLWADYREIARSFCLAACWSTPVISADGQVLATFAMYYEDPRHPTERERAFIERVGQFVRVAIERTNQHERLRESETRYRSIFDLVPVAIWEEDWTPAIELVDRLTDAGIEDIGAYLRSHPDEAKPAVRAIRALNANDTAVSMFGADSRDHLLRSAGRLFVRSETSEIFISRLVALAEGRHVLETEDTIHDLNGRPIHVLVRIALPDRSTGNTRALITELDITDRKRADERFRIITQTTSDVVWDRDLESGEFWCSEGLKTWFGLDPDAFASGRMALNDRIHPEDRNRVLNAIRAAIESPDVEFEEEYRFARADGSYAIVRDQAAVTRDPGGRPIRMVGSLLDITEQRHLEEQLREAQRLDAIGRLTGGIAHDFNNLLTVILGNSEILADSLDNDPRLREIAEMTGNAATRGAELTNRLLSFARKQPLNPKPLDVNRLVHNLESLLRRTLGEAIEMEVVQSGGLWKALADGPQLESAILNLCINSRDAMPDGGRLTIETANASLDDDYAAAYANVDPGQYVVVAVSDNGSGMDQATLSRVFEPFFTTKDVGKGSGLGLSMVYGFAKQSKGHVRVYSEPGQGTTVKLYLPRITGATSHVQQYTGDVSVRKGSGSILLVEDDDLVREHVERQLRSLGYQVASAANAQAALDVLKGSHAFDLLFTDVVMPGAMSGPQLAERASELRPGLPVLFTSGYTENSMMHHGRLDHGVELLQKPYRRQQLAEKIRKVIEDSRRST